MGTNRKECVCECVGEVVCECVGECVGESVGDAVGERVGEVVGEVVGEGVGEFGRQTSVVQQRLRSARSTPVVLPPSLAEPSPLAGPSRAQESRPTTGSPIQGWWAEEEGRRGRQCPPPPRPPPKKKKKKIDEFKKYI